MLFAVGVFILLYYNLSKLHAGSVVIAFGFMIAMSGVTLVLEGNFSLFENFTK